MKVLFIGGTGIISSACSPLSIERGHDLYLFKRGQSVRPTPAGAQVLEGNFHDPESMKEVLGSREFDVVVNWIVFSPEQMQKEIEFFKGRTGQYVFISSASAYQTPPSSLPVTESTVLDNPVWEYSRNKIACEELLVDAYRRDKFPYTIVRPSHTYDQTLLPFHGRYTVIDRMRKGKPVIVHGDGTSIWTMTHHRDFAKGFVGLLGNSHAIAEAVHITSDELLTWNQIYQILARAAGAQPDLVHVPSDLIAAYDRTWGDSLLGDKSNSMIFDNSKIKRLVPGFAPSIPFSQGAEEIMAWYDADSSRQVIDEEFDAIIERILSAYQQAWPR